MKNRKATAAVLAVVCILTFLTDFVSRADEPKQTEKAEDSVQQIAGPVTEVRDLETVKTVSDNLKELTGEVFRVKEETEKAAAEKAKKEAEKARKEKEAREKREAKIRAAEKELLAALIFCEAGGESYQGQLAVGAVVMNRVKSGRFPNSLQGVIYQRGQFGPALTGKLDHVMASGRTTESCRNAAAQALAGESPVGSALYFGDGQNRGTKIGGHWFHS